MVFYLALFLIAWSMIFTAGKFLQYYKIERNYQNKTKARIAQMSPHAHIKGESKEKKTDLILEYEIDGKRGRTEVTMTTAAAQEYSLGDELSIRYYQSPNGAVHLASDNGAVRKFVFGYGFAIIVELIAFVIIWLQVI